MNVNIFQIAMNINEPPGIIHPLFQENYAWVDECLREKYYNNFDNFYKWIDENSLYILKPTPITWANYKSRTILKCIEDEAEGTEEEGNKSFITDKYRTRAESDISNYEVNVGKVILNAYSNSVYNNYMFDDKYFDYVEDISTTNSSHESQESYYSYDSY
jgi:hypothetical protein